MQSTEEKLEHTALSNSARCEMSISYVIVDQLNLQIISSWSYKIPHEGYLQRYAKRSFGSTVATNNLFEEGPKFQRLLSPFRLLLLHPCN